MRTIKKAIALLGSFAAAAAVSASALSVFAFEPVDLGDRASELKSGLNIIADEVYAEPGETVLYNVYIQNNTGYAGSGIGLIYDEALTPAIVSASDRPELTYGDGSYMLSKTADYSAAEHRIGVGTMGNEDCTGDGVIFTAKFTVPADAKENDEFKLTLDVDKFLDYKTDKVAYSTVDGWIRIRKPQVTTTSVTTPTTTSTSITTTTTTTSTTESVTVPTDISTESDVSTTSSTKPTTVTTTITTDVSTVSNTKKTDRDDPGKSEPTTASRQNGGTQTTKSPVKSSTTKTSATKTGDAGVGIAAAALMLSAATAVTCKRKKH